MIRVIIFDFFGVFRTDGYNNWLNRHGHVREGAFLEASERHDRGEYSEMQYFQAIADASGEPAEQVKYELETGNELNQPLVEYMHTLQGRYKLALLSNSASTYLRNELAKYDLVDCFDEVVISSEVGLIKPAPEIFEYVVQKLGVDPGECIFTDDSPRNITAAEKLGIHAIAYVTVPELKRQIEKITADNQ